MTIQLRTAALLNPHLSLDGLLAAAIFKRTGDVEKAHADIPLSRRDGVWCGSSVQLERGHSVTAAFTQALRHRDFNSDRYSDHRKRGGRITVLIAGGQFKPALDLSTPWIGKLAFLGHGDADACMELVESLPGIGAKAAAHGFGRMEWVDVEPWETDGLSDQGRPLRSVPIETWKAWGHIVDDECGVDMLRSAPPYWSGAPRPCVFPAPPARR
ncbi:hypothetical protein E4T66_17675 [Sinimarinibacterium sp. CAU 1509]|uniref:hypothetical protein n=1 Tax=Sinimarinibacterium sp. CAU 1509 TaxID=2562283 RepID=UPI0010ACBFB5|nr:hypothetical protein [Sinimarinibacterium sp. CAU 1509]TJY57237.1 hypothetical protein E4T66_17675 [Sinimarinibacterium sp. CAU 1509]